MMRMLHYFSYIGGGDYSVSTVYDIIAHHALSAALFDNRLSHYWHRASSLDRFSLY